MGINLFQHQKTDKMRIGILTLPLNTNYGGILQAYALQTVLQRIGHEVILIERRNEVVEPTDFKSKIIKRITKVLLGKDNLKLVLWGQVDNFKRDNINLLQMSDLEAFDKTAELDAYVVGSDQVWRPFWKENYIPDFFLEFAKGNNKVKKIAYAASFAVDEWEFTAEETQRYAPLAKLFDTISVREASGVGLCQRYLNVDAVQMLDPTLLLDKSDYENLIRKRNNRTTSKAKIFTYILDDSDYKQNVISYAENQLNLSPFKLTFKECNSFIQLLFAKKRYQIPGVEKWLRAFMDSEYVITDSFHGCVFSIIFNKPFWAIGNSGRGMARFTSLLHMFGLEDRLLFDTTEVQSLDFSKPIDWTSINAIRKEWQIKAYDFLKTNLYSTK